MFVGLVQYLEIRVSQPQEKFIANIDVYTLVQVFSD